MRPAQRERSDPHHPPVSSQTVCLSPDGRVLVGEELDELGDEHIERMVEGI